MAQDIRGEPARRRARRYDPFAIPSRHDRYLRLPDGWSRRLADVADPDLGRLNWAESRPTGVAQGTAGIGRRPGIPRYSVSPHFRGLPNRRRQRRPRPLCRIGNHPPHMADNRKDHLVAISLRTIVAAASTRWHRLRARRLDAGIDAERYSDRGTDESACREDQKTHGETARQVFKVAHHIRPAESRKVAECVDRCNPRRR